MKPLSFTVYLVRRNTKSDGTGAMVPDLCFADRGHAEKYYIDSRWSEGDWDIVGLEVLEVDYVEFKEQENDIKKAALAKLTSLEKRLLGLEEDA